MNNKAYEMVNVCLSELPSERPCTRSLCKHTSALEFDPGNSRINLLVTRVNIVPEPFAAASVRLPRVSPDEQRGACGSWESVFSQIASLSGLLPGQSVLERAIVGSDGIRHSDPF